MPKMIQIRHVPPRLHSTLKARAAMAGMSLSDYLIAELSKSARQLTPSEVSERLARLSPVAVRESTARAVRAERDSR